MSQTTTPTNRSHRMPTPYPTNTYRLRGHHRRGSYPIPGTTTTAPAGTLTGSFRSVSIGHSSAQDIPSSSSSAIFLPYRTQADDSPSRIARDEWPEYGPGYAPVFDRIISGETYRARMRARGQDEFAGDLFFGGRGGDRYVERSGGGDFAAGQVGLPNTMDGGGGLYDDESDCDGMSAITHVSACERPVAPELECGICMRRKISVQFRECSHALCAPCAKALWRSRVSPFTPFPGSVPCHLCRAEVRGVGKLRARVPGFGDAYRHGGKKFTVWKWEELRPWALGGKRNRKSLPSTVAEMARRLGGRVANAGFTNGRDLQDVRDF